MKFVDSKLITLLALLLFSLSLFFAPASVTSESLNSETEHVETGLQTSRPFVRSEHPYNYTRVEWDQGTVNEQFIDSWRQRYYQFGPVLTWELRNVSTGTVIPWDEGIPLDEWVNLRIKVPLSALAGATPFGIVFQSVYYDMSKLGPEGQMTSEGSTPIAALGMYVISEDRWDSYSSTNLSMNGGSPEITPFPGMTLEDVFGPMVDPFLEMDIGACGAYEGSENYWANFRIRLNQSATPGFYYTMGIAIDTMLMPIAQSIGQEFSGAIYGATFEELVFQAVGGFYDFDRVDDDGDVLLSATRGDDFNMTLEITNGTIIANASVSFDIPSQVLVEQWVYGSYIVEEEVQGAWVYNPMTQTYVWNATIWVTKNTHHDGLHLETFYSYVDLAKEYLVYDPWQGQWFSEWAWPSQSIVYHFHNDSFTTNLGYDYRTYIPDGDGGWYESWIREYEPFPMDGSIPMPYILNLTTSEYYEIDGKHVVTMRGHVSEDVLPTGGEFNSNPLWIDSDVVGIDGRSYAPVAYLPNASAEEMEASELLRQLAIESPISVVRLTLKNKPYNAGWMFQVDIGETFTVKSLLQGGSELADDIDGVALYLYGYKDDWGVNGGEEWWQYSQVDIEIKISDTGQVSTTVYNSTYRTAWEYGEHYEWQYVEIYPGSGIWEWREVLLEGYSWRELWYDFEYDEFTPEYIPYHHNKTIMNVDYLSVGNLTYKLLGDDLRVAFDVTPLPSIPQWEWNWEFFYGNLTLVTDYESGDELRLVKGWVEETVYHYMNSTQRVYVTPPNREPVFQNNNTGALYAQDSYPYIAVGGEKLPVETYYTDYGGTLEEHVVFERWNPEGYDEASGTYSGAMEYWYQLKNGTRVPIYDGSEVFIYNITLDDGRWFESFYNWTEYNELTHEEFLRAINGTAIVVSNYYERIYDYTSEIIERNSAKQTESVVVYANDVKPVILATRPEWDYDHYVLYLNGTWERLDAFFNEVYDTVYEEWIQVYEYWNETDEQWYQIKAYRGGDWYYIPSWEVFETEYLGMKYFFDGWYTEYYAYTTIDSIDYPLPFPGATVYWTYDLEYATPRDYYVYINGTGYRVNKYSEYMDGYDPVLAYSYKQYWADVEGQIVNMTLYSYDTWCPKDPVCREDLPFTAVANGTLQIAELFHAGWTIAVGHTDIMTRQFVVDDWLDVVTGEYDSWDPTQVFTYNETGKYNYVETKVGELLNYTQGVRAYFYDITLENGTHFYSIDNWFYDVGYENETTGHWDVEYYYFLALNGSEIRVNEFPEFTWAQVNSTIVDDIDCPNYYYVDGFWYEIYLVWWDYYHYLVASNGTTYEVVDLTNDWEMRYNIPNFNFTLDGGNTWIDVIGAKEMVYKAYWTHGVSKKLDYVALPVTISRTQWSLVIGTPRYGMWGLQTWAVDETTGALDLDGDLTTTYDQFYVKNIYENSNIFNVTEEYMWVNILWEPDSSLLDDEFHLNSYTGMVTFNRTNSWNDTYIWYHADSLERITSEEMDQIQDILFDAEGYPAPGYWDISWMGENFTSADLAAQAEAEGWDWYSTSQEWSWVWWDLQEGYSTEVNNGTHTAVMDIDVAYAFAGMLSWTDNDGDAVMDIDFSSIGSAELSHYWMPESVDSVTFTTPGLAWGNPNTTDMEYRDVNETIDFGVSFANVSGMVFPFGVYSYFDWYDGQYYGSDLSSFEDRPTYAAVDEFAIDVHFTGYVNETGANCAEVKFDMLVGDWDIDTPGGRDVLEDCSLAIAFYSELTVVTPEGQEAPSYYLDDYGSPISNNQTAPSSNYTMGTGLSSVAMMGLGGSSYVWEKNRSISARASAQSVPLDTFSRMYISGSGGSATAFNITTRQFYTLIGFNYWDGYEVEVDPVFVSYISRGTADVEAPVIDSIGTPSSIDVTGTEHMRIEIEAHDNGSDVQTVKVWDTDNDENYTADWDEGLGAWVALVPRTMDGRYDLNFVIVVVDNSGNEAVSEPQVYTFRDNIDPTITSVTNSTSADGLGREIAVVTAQVEDLGGSGIDSVVLTYSNISGSFVVPMVDNAGTWEGIIPNQPEDTFVPWYVTVTDGDGNTVVSSSEIYHFAPGEGPDTAAPSIGGYQISPEAPTPDDVVTVSATIMDSSGVASATLQYRIGSGDWKNVTMTTEGSIYSGNIPAQADGTTIYYRIVASDTLGNEAVTSEFSYIVEEEVTTTTTTTTTSTTTTTTTTTTSTTTPLPIDTTVLMLGAGAVVLVMLIVLLKRRK